MQKTLKIGDHVRWNSEAGWVSGVIIKKLTSDTKVKGYVHHASRDAPQYLIKSDKTDHVAIHKGSALRLMSAQDPKRPSQLYDDIPAFHTYAYWNNGGIRHCH